MIRRLQGKFILINMLLITIVLVITFGAVYMSTQQRLVRDSMSLLELEVRSADAPGSLGGRDNMPVFERTIMDEKHPAPPPDEVHGPENNPGVMPMPMFTVSLDNNRNIISTRGTLFDLSDEKALSKIVAICLTNNGDTGVIPDASLRYLKHNTGKGMNIAFVDRSLEINTLTSLVKTSLLVGAGSLLAFFLISLFLGKWALRPVEKAWQQQKQFVADASHELKTPLTVIRANADIVLAHQQETVQEQAQWIEYIQAEANRMTTLVNNLLFLARTDEAQSNVILSRINLSDIVWGSVLPFEPVAFEQEKTLQTNIAPGLYTNGDENQIKQLLGILLDNACKYSGRQGTVSVKLARNAEHKVVLAVNNTGSYIPADQQEQIFERFFRLDKSRSRENGGYGLGLAIARSIVRMHNGKISVQSTPEAGTTFTVILTGIPPGELP